MMQLVTEDVGQIFLFHNPQVLAFASTVRGPGRWTDDGATVSNVHEWERL
jgi:hypothetical protein